METVRVCWSISEDNGEEDAAVGVTSPRHVTRTDGVRRCLHNRSVTGDDDDTTTRVSEAAHRSEHIQRSRPSI